MWKRQANLHICKMETFFIRSLTKCGRILPCPSQAPTPPVIRIVFLHTEPFAERLFEHTLYAMTTYRCAVKIITLLNTFSSMYQKFHQLTLYTLAHPNTDYSFIQSIIKMGTSNNRHEIIFE